MDDLERLVIAGRGGELFTPRLRDELLLDVSPCGKQTKSVFQACMKTMKGARMSSLATNHPGGRLY